MRCNLKICDDSEIIPYVRIPFAVCSEKAGCQKLKKWQQEKRDKNRSDKLHNLTMQGCY